ncbi:hypothetical protein [Streptomyces sp. NPDC094149]|uniref:hypothetical protein n=1 Tax=Streptomyces sp. NPDC094149 TaxID=3155079 RepID=UPI003316977C
MLEPRDVFCWPLAEDFAALALGVVFGLAEPLALELDDRRGVALTDAEPTVSADFGWVVTSGVAVADPASTLWPGSNAMTRYARTPAAVTATVVPSTSLRLRLRCRATCLVVMNTGPFGIEPLVHWSVAARVEKVADDIAGMSPSRWRRQ